MGRYKWGYKQGNHNYNPYSGTYNPLITAHEPPSSVFLEFPLLWLWGKEFLDLGFVAFGVRA